MQALKAYFRGLIFVYLCPEHVIIVAYLLNFRGLIFVFGLSITKIKPNENFPLYGNYCVSCLAVVTQLTISPFAPVSPCGPKSPYKQQ